VQTFVVPALRQEREGRGTHGVGNASEIKKLGRPPDLKIGSGRYKEAIQTRDYCVAKDATLRADRSDPSAGKKRQPRDDNVTT
jgi:hypothetical protein